MNTFLPPFLRTFCAVLVCVSALLSFHSASADPTPSPDYVMSAATCTNSCLFMPVVYRSAADPGDRQYSLDLYKTVYLAPTPAIGWTGNYSSCNPGVNSTAWNDAVLRRINYFREMAGLPKVSFSDSYNQEAQAAALTEALNTPLRHDPPNTWRCWSQLGYEGASSSNLFGGVNGPDAITGYMDDYGLTSMGHRRWIIYPQTKLMGTGDTPGGSGAVYSTNALHVFDEVNMWGPRPTTRDGFVAWPPPVYVPYTVVFAYWTFSYPDADFSSASIRMLTNGSQMSTTRYSQVDGYGENTLVWKVNSINGSWPRPSSDTTYDVTIDGVKYNSSTHSFHYQVVVFDPGN